VFRLDAQALHLTQQSLAQIICANAADVMNLQTIAGELRRRHRLIRPFSAGDHLKIVAQHSLAKRRKSRRATDQIHVDGADDDDGFSGAHKFVLPQMVHR